MQKKHWQNIWVYIAIPAIMLLYYNQSANWHYHITGEGIIVEHAHPFSNSLIPDTPFQDHEHSDFQYLVLAQLMHALGLIVVLLLFLGILFQNRNRNTPIPAPLFFAGIINTPNPTRGPPPGHRH